MIWGMILQTSKIYKMKMDQSIRMTMASLDTKTCHGPDPVQLMVSVNDESTRFLLCTLDKIKVWQMPLNLSIEKGSIVTFTSNGVGFIHLTGYYKYPLMIKGVNAVDVEDFEDLEDFEDTEDITETVQGQALKRKAKSSTNERKRKKLSAKIKNVCCNCGEDPDDPTGYCYDDSDNSRIDKAAFKENMSSATSSSCESENEEPEEGKVKTIMGSLKMIRLKAGTGPAAEIGKDVTIKYVARVWIGPYKPVIDKVLRDKGLTFTLGHQEVLRGVDIGTIGMKVGEKRRILIPPKYAYGTEGNPPTIPPFSILEYEVELIKIK